MFIDRPPSRQRAESVFVVRPAAFADNRQTACSNCFQHPSEASNIAMRAAAELEQVTEAIAAAGVNVCIAEDTADPPKPDAVFPNNWISWHRDGPSCSTQCSR